MERNQQRKITRNRELRACVECRKRKLRCDRQMPCASCVRRNGTASCVYEGNLDGQHGENGRRLQAEAKLEHLEQLVQELSQSRKLLVTHDGLTSDANVVQHSREELTNNSVYNGATHWSAMLEGIEELRTVIRDFDDTDDARVAYGNGESNGIDILFGAAKPLSFQQVLSQFLPMRQEADRMVAAYFRAKAVAAPFLHSIHFSRLYQLFWDDPLNASPLWTSMLFSVFDAATKCLSTSFRAKVDEDSQVERFAIAAAHCLAFGEYYRPQKFAVEALLLYIQTKCVTGVDLDPLVATLFGTLIRLATIMGYHRDPGESRKGISVFEGEMRRRTWSLCMQLDMLISFQLGLPSNIQFPTWDTMPPTNLLDSDFDENTVRLPPARPDSEPTDLLFYIVKHKIMAVFEKIIRHTLSANEQSDDELEAIDQELRDTYATLPAIFQPRSMTDSIADSSSIIITRLCVNFIYQKCLCALHRKYVTRGRQKSVQICHDSASELVRRFWDIHDEFGPGGQLETERWFMSSITWHDFLLGCTALCLTVCSTRYYAGESASLAMIDIVGSLELLHNAKAVCEKLHARSRDTRKVRRLIDATILKISEQPNGNTVTEPISRNNGQSMTTDVHWLAEPSPSASRDWLWDESTILPAEEASWAFMGQFLDLPAEHFMTDI